MINPTLIDFPRALPPASANWTILTKLLDECSSEIKGGCAWCALLGPCSRAWDEIPAYPDGGITPVQAQHYEKLFGVFKRIKVPSSLQERNDHHSHGEYYPSRDRVKDEPFESLRLPFEE